MSDLEKKFELLTGVLTGLRDELEKTTDRLDHISAVEMEVKDLKSHLTEVKSDIEKLRPSSASASASSGSKTADNIFAPNSTAPPPAQIGRAVATAKESATEKRLRERQQKALRELADNRSQVIRNAAITGCQLSGNENIVGRSWPVIEYKGVNVPAEGYAIVDNVLYVVDPSGVMLESQAAGSTSHQAFGKVRVVNASGVPIGSVVDTFAGHAVVMSLCAGGSITLFREINPFRDGNQVSYQYIATTTLPDGAIGKADSPQVLLSQFNSGNQGGQISSGQFSFRSTPNFGRWPPTDARCRVPFIRLLAANASCPTARFGL